MDKNEQVENELEEQREEEVQPTSESVPSHPLPVTTDEEPETKQDALADLFEVPQEEDNDIGMADLFEVEDQTVDMEDDLSDLTQVTEEDVMGTPPPPPQKAPAPAKPRYRRTTRRYYPPVSVGGVSG